MDIVINGTTKHVEEGMTALQLIEFLGLSNKRLAMEVNREIVPRSSFPDFQLQANDNVEIVHAIGGG